VHGVGWDIIIVLAIILIGGFFAAAEMALVSLREGQVRALAKRGKRGAKAAKLAHDPNRFLSAVQIGVTVATLLSGAFGAATLASDLDGILDKHLSAHLASVLAFLIVTLVIAFFSLVLGELAPKRIALQRQQQIAWFAAPILDFIAVIARPVVWLISVCVNLVVRVLGGDPKAGRGVMSSDELRDLVTAHQTLSADERHIVSEVFDAGTRQIREVLVPRTEVEFLPASMPVAQAMVVAAAATHSRFPVFEDSYDLVEELIGDIQDEYDEEDDPSRRLRTGEIEVDGLMNLDDFAEQTGIELPDGPYETVAGYLLSALGHLPQAGEAADFDGSKLTVTELDGRRIAKVKVSAGAPAPVTPAK